MDIYDIRNKPIGVFDSGIGGISVLALAEKMLPHENFIYYGDDANAPYGNRPENEIRSLALDCAAFLVDKGVKAIVVACNTATSAAVADIRKKFSIPVISMEPAVKPAFKYIKDGNIIVLATEATLKQKKYLNLKDKMPDKSRIIDSPLRELVSLIEQSHYDDDVACDNIKSVLEKHPKDIDVMVLGCTHFLFVKDALNRAAKDLYGKELPLIDGNVGTVNQLKRVLDSKDLLKQSGEGKVKLFSSGDLDMLKEFYIIAKEIKYN